MSSRLVVCGSIAIDRIMSFRGKYEDLIRPEKLDVFSLSVLIDELRELPGGTAANISYNLALLGEEPTIFGSVGKDAENYIQRLAAAGIDTAEVFYSKDSTATFTVLNDSFDNQVGGFYPGAMADSGALSVAKYAGDDVIITISAHDPIAMKRQVCECKEHALRLLYDVSQQVSNVSSEDIREGVEVAEIVIVNDYERAVLSKKLGVSKEKLQHMVPVLITTHGKDGSVVEGTSVEGSIAIRPAKPVKVIDPTGAGDAFRAGFLYGYARNWGVKKAAQLGSVSGSFAVEEYGGQIQYNKDDVMKRYKETYREEIRL